MTISDAARMTRDKATAHLVRYRSDSVQSGTAQYDVKEYGQGTKRGWVMLDIFTASAIVAVYDVLNDIGRAKLQNLPLKVLAAFCLRHVR